MAFCTACGNNVGNNAFCTRCGRRSHLASAARPRPAYAPPLSAAVVPASAAPAPLAAPPVRAPGGRPSPIRRVLGGVAVLLVVITVIQGAAGLLEGGWERDHEEPWLEMEPVEPGGPPPTGEWRKDVAAMAPQSEAWPTLVKLHALQNVHRAEHGRYASRLEGAPPPEALQGWGDPESPFFRFAVSVATEEDLCVEAHLTEEGRTAGLTESSVDEEGLQHLGLACTGPVVQRSWTTTVPN